MLHNARGRVCYIMLGVLHNARGRVCYIMLEAGCVT